MFTIKIIKEEIRDSKFFASVYAPKYTGGIWCDFYEITCEGRRLYLRGKDHNTVATFTDIINVRHSPGYEIILEVQ